MLAGGQRDEVEEALGRGAQGRESSFRPSLIHEIDEGLGHVVPVRIAEFLGKESQRPPICGIGRGPTGGA